jgi:hypothetical protein
LTAIQLRILWAMLIGTFSSLAVVNYDMWVNYLVCCCWIWLHIMLVTFWLTSFDKQTHIYTGLIHSEASILLLWLLNFFFTQMMHSQLLIQCIV